MVVDEVRRQLDQKLLSAVGAVLRTPDVRIYQACLWAKYGGPHTYDQRLHLDSRNQSLLVPSEDPAFHQVNAVVCLNDVDDDSATRVVSRQHTSGLAYDEADLDRARRPKLYALEQSTVGPAGSLLLFEARTYHRAVDISRPGAARFVLNTAFRTAQAEWVGYHAWPFRGKRPEWVAWLARSSPAQLQALGFPPPHHPYWTPGTLRAVGLRYPGIDLSAWEA
ncbi:phytanoyl-CoA dioxygenase family protein [Kitasatospora aureofaciens]|uniref:phytanoyl-CoA dioxygenase family protein n=1 Tax=Kitasatospora aureofaciens TaxID=1894 RepID=UPI0033E2E01C